jgi:hypothetical protein
MEPSYQNDTQAGICGNSSVCVPARRIEKAGARLSRLSGILDSILKRFLKTMKM